jgi:hypothetical protein
VQLLDRAGHLRPVNPAHRRPASRR